jgi:hypothetical protein
MGFEEIGFEFVDGLLSSRAAAAPSKFKLKWARPFASGRMRAALAIAGLVLVILTDLVGLASLMSFQINAIVVGSRRFAFDIGTANMVAIAGALVAFLIWVERAYRNLPALGATHPLSSPMRAAVGLFFPKRGAFSASYLVMSEIWGHSDPAQHDNLRKTGSRLVKYWWAGYILCFVIWAVGESIMTVGRPEYTIFRNVFYAAQLAGAIVAILLVYSIDKNQQASHALIEAQREATVS